MFIIIILKGVIFISLSNHIGEKYGYLTVVEMLREPDKTYCKCKCVCGNYIKRTYSNLKKGSNLASCGCKRIEVNDKQSRNIIGQKFGRLTVLSENKVPYRRSVICQCDCGNTTVVRKTQLMAGNTRSCDCLWMDDCCHANEKDWTGQISEAGVRFISKAYMNKTGQWLWNCECPLCHNIFVILPAKVMSNHTSSCGCRIKSLGEQFIREILEENKIEYIPQYSFVDCRDKKKLRFDFALFKNGEVFHLIEFDGGQHYQPVKYFGGEKQFNKQHARDILKNEYCEQHNLPLTRIKYTLSKNTIKKIIMNILNP